MVETAPASMVASPRRTAILQAVADTAERVLLADDWQSVADGVLEELGRAAGVSRAYIIRNRIDEEGATRGTLVFEWCDEDIRSLRGDPFLDDTDWSDGFSRWADLHRRGEAVMAIVASLPDEERAELEQLGVVSVVELPIMVEGRWWGSLGLDDDLDERRWADGEVEGLRTAASVIAAAIRRQRTHEELTDGRERYRQLVERIPGVTYTDIVQPDGSVRMGFVSPQIEALLGYPPHVFLDDPERWFAMIHPEDLARLKAVGAFDVADTSDFDQEYRMIAADGHAVWVHDTSIASYRADGSVEHFLGFLVDVTARVEAERRLRDAEEHYRALVEHIPAIVYTESPDADPERFYMSPQVRSVLGYEPEEWRWTPGFWFDRIHPDDLEAVRETDARSNATRVPYAMDYRFRHAEGHWVWLRDEATFVPEPDGEGFWQGVILDVSERKRAEEQLKEAELKFRTIVEHNQAIFYTQEIDPDDPSVSNTTYIAPGNTDLIGYTLDEVRADPALWRAIVHPEDRARIGAADAESNTSGTDHFSEEYRMIAKDGRVVWVQDEATLVQLEGRAPYWQGFLLDVTERKDAEVRLAQALAVEREAAQRLRTLDDMKNTFLQAVSHDLRTPLAAILGLAITLSREDVALPATDARDLATRIADNARRLDRLVTNLLDLDRLSRGITSPYLQPTNVGELAASVVRESGLVDDDRLVLELEPVTASIDAAKVERIVENLVANAARHAPDASRVWVRVWMEDGGVVLAVEDEGDGIDPDIRELVFQPFQQGPDAPRHAPGVGVGLTLVERFASLHDGRAWVEDRDGGGASFRVWLPMAPGAGSGDGASR